MDGMELVILSKECRYRLKKGSLSAAKGCLYLDRDGVIIRDKHYISNPNDVELMEGARSLIKTALQEMLAVAVVTNQSGIGRGFFNWEAYERVTDRMLELLSEDIPDIILANGYSPENNQGTWRKPGAGMLEKASSVLGLDSMGLKIMVGDRQSDIEAGINGGVDIAALVEGSKEAFGIERTERRGETLVVHAKQLKDVERVVKNMSGAKGR